MGSAVIVDYGVGNLKSVSNAMAYIGQKTLITGDPGELERADAIILPGVGAFPDAADKLRSSGLDKILLAQAGRKSAGTAWSFRTIPRCSEGWTRGPMYILSTPSAAMPAVRMT